MRMHPPFLLLICSFCSFCISSNMHHPHPPFLHQQKLPNWHRKLIIQLLLDMLALCSNETGVDYSAAARWPDDLEQGWKQKISNEWRLQHGERHEDISSLRHYLTDEQIGQSCEESCEGQYKGATAPSHALASFTTSLLSHFFIRLDRTDVSISECVSLGVSSLAKSVAHAVWNRAPANTF